MIAYKNEMKNIIANAYKDDSVFTTVGSGEVFRGEKKTTKDTRNFADDGKDWKGKKQNFVRIQVWDMNCHLGEWQ